MRNFLKSSRRWLSTGWFWPLVLLALPTCGLQTDGLDGPILQPGSELKSSAVMCDIPKLESVDNVLCAKDLEDEKNGIPLAQAAIALATSQSKMFGFDYSPAAVGACTQAGFPGLPRRTEFYGKFPDGLAVCLNCGTQIPAFYADGNEVCHAQCQDLIHQDHPNIAFDFVKDWCEAHAHVSTNFDKTKCFHGVCTDGGSEKPFVDPRRSGVNAAWAILIGTSAPDETTLQRDAMQTGNGVVNFDAGAATDPVIFHGDGWVEFEAGEFDNKSHVLGLFSANCFPCDPNDPGLLDDIGFAIALNGDGFIYVLESGVLQPGPGEAGSHGPYAPGEQYRVHFTDNFDGTATISYFGPCTPGQLCTDKPLGTQNGALPNYPLRIGAAFREKDATLKKVKIVRIE